MLENIKSLYFIKNIFLKMNERTKFKIIKYNKHMQNIININLLDYKIFSGTYIKFESNEKVKEYNSRDNELVFEGEFANGKRNGKGKEYYSGGDLKFEGEYKNGKKCNGREYDVYGHLIFEGEYQNGKKWNRKGYFNHRYNNNKIIYSLIDGKGYVKECCGYSNFLIYEGQYLNGERNGKGKEYDINDVLIFEGEYKNGKRWNGKVYDKNNNIISKIKDGKGFVIENITYYALKIKLESEYLNGEINGIHKEYLFDKLVFEGELLNDKKHGKGKAYDSNNKLIFEGEYLNGYQRKGKEYYADGNLEYEGEFLFDKKWDGKGYNKNGNIIYELHNGNGNVKEYSCHKLIFEGEYLDGKKIGKGKEYKDDGKLIFDGEYLDDKRNGKGKEYNIDGKLIFDGEYLDDKRNGKGKEYNDDGKVIFDGEYLNGEKKI